MIILLFLAFSSPLLAQEKTRALIVMTSRDVMATKTRPTGYRIMEVAQAWDVFHRAGLQVDFSSRLGGRPPADSTGYALQDSAVMRFHASQEAQVSLGKTMPIALVKPEQYSVVLFVGGHGALWDFLEDPVFASIAGKVHAQGGILATVSHGAAVLLTTLNASGASILQRARLTCVSDEEEEADGFMRDIPYMLETALRRGGAIHYREAKHVSNVVAEDRLITGQNSESARDVADSIVLKLELMRTEKNTTKRK